MLEDELMHYGILGMKWGQRKKSSTTSAKQAKRQKQKNIRKQVKAVKKSRRNAAKRRVLLSDEEIEKRIQRLNKEKRLKELTDEQISPGRTAVKNTIKRVSSKVLDSSFNIGEGLIRVELGLSGNKDSKKKKKSA